MKEKFIFGMLMALASYPSLGATSLPWETPLCKIATSLRGPVASSTAVIVLVVTGLMFAFGEASGTFKTMLGVLGGLSLAFLAVTILTDVFQGQQSDFKFTDC